MSGYRTSVSNISFPPKLSEFETDGYFIAIVDIENVAARAQPFSAGDFRLQTPAGTVVDSMFSTVMQEELMLRSGDLVTGGQVHGAVVFQVGKRPRGTYYIIYKPDPFSAARGIWGVPLP